MSTYLAGLDILGAVGAARQQLKQITKAATAATNTHKAAAQNVISKGQQIARKHPKLGNAFVKFGKASARKADIAAKKIVTKGKPIAKTAAASALARAAAVKPTAKTAASAALSKESPVTALRTIATALKPTVAARPTVPTAATSRQIMTRSLIHGDAPPAPVRAPAPEPLDSVTREPGTSRPMGPPPTPVEAADIATINTLGDYIANTMGPLIDQLEEGATGTADRGWTGASASSALFRQSLIQGVVDTARDSLAREGEKIYDQIANALNASAQQIDNASDHSVAVANAEVASSTSDSAGV